MTRNSTRAIRPKYLPVLVFEINCKMLIKIYVFANEMDTVLATLHKKNKFPI